jgi:asparagine synthetase B (glutamine-hydrolysing)
VTGDAADELFGGYSFTHRLDDAAWQHNRERMARLMRFGSVPLGGCRAVNASLTGGWHSRLHVRAACL